MTSEEIRRFRNSRAWRDRTRKVKLLQDPYCELCIKKDKLAEAKEVDHIVPLEKGGAPHDFANLQSLCKRCHVIKSAEENRERNLIRQNHE